MNGGKRSETARFYTFLPLGNFACRAARSLDSSSPGHFRGCGAGTHDAEQRLLRLVREHHHLLAQQHRALLSITTTVRTAAA